MCYQDGSNEVEIATEIVGEDDEQIADEQTEQDNKDLHQSDVEVADHIQLRESVFGSHSHPSDRGTRPEERETI